MSDTQVKETAIVGGGFAGLAAARRLRGATCRVTVLDRRNHHVFQPLLYQVAIAALNPGDIAYPIRAALRRQKNARVVLVGVKAIDTASNTIELENGSLEYDYLMLATVRRSAAVADLGKFRFSGYFARVFWWLVHVFFLIGFRNRFLVMFSWAWSCLTFQRGARLITGKTGPLPRFEERRHRA